MTEQMRGWVGNFGKKYTARNTVNLQELDKLYIEMYGITCTELMKSFYGRLNRNIKILEVGSNIGNQLLLLKNMGFCNLYGIEINDYAIELCKSRTKNINIIRASAFDIPFKDRYFDLVFTAGVLIHISPKDIKKAISEIYRCSSKYIWGYEYYSEKYTEILYYGRENLMWKANFPKIYTDTFRHLKVMKLKFLKYLQNENVDVMFLLKKQ